MNVAWWVFVVSANAMTDREVYSLLDSKQFLTARREAEVLLADDPNSIVGHAVIGTVLWESEGSHASAMVHLRQARDAIERVAIPSEGLLSEVHPDVMWALQEVAGDMESYAEQLAFMNAFETRYDPPFIAERGWPLMKLGREREAEMFARKGLASDNDWQRAVGWNVLCVLSAESGHREEGVRNCEAALSFVRSSQAASLAIAGGNASSAAAIALQFSDAERWALEGAAVHGPFSVSPWLQLISLYVDQGRLVDAVAAMRSLRRSQLQQSPSHRDLNRAEIDSMFAVLLLALGEAEQGMVAIDRALKWPDRRGRISSDAAQARGGHTLIRLSLRKLSDEVASEKASARGWRHRLVHGLRSLLPDASRSADEAMVRSTLTDRRRLINTFRIRLDGGLVGSTPWQMGELVDALGVGVSSVALLGAREEEIMPSMQSYFDAVEGLIRHRHKDWPGVQEMALKALAGLPTEEVLLRAQLHAIHAESLWNLGEDAAALVSFEKAFQLDPGIIRREGLALPAAIEADSSPVSERVVRTLSRSPRLTRSTNAFVVRVRHLPSQISVCLFSAMDTRLGCAETPLAAGDEANWVVDAVDNFHNGVFASALGLSSADLRSLDSTTTTINEAARAEMERMLETL